MKLAAGTLAARTLAAGTPVEYDPTNPAQDELYQKLKSQYPGVDEPDLRMAATKLWVQIMEKKKEEFYTTFFPERQQGMPPQQPEQPAPPAAPTQPTAVEPGQAMPSPPQGDRGTPYNPKVPAEEAIRQLVPRKMRR